jgi:muconolactone delta-isomerase
MFSYRDKQQSYLCRVPDTGIVIVLREEDYKYRRNHEARLREPDSSYNIVLLAEGTWREMWMYHGLINGGNITNVS